MNANSVNSSTPHYAYYDPKTKTIISPILYPLKIKLDSVIDEDAIMEYILKKRMGEKEYYEWKRYIKEYHEWYVNEYGNSKRNDEWLYNEFIQKTRELYNKKTGFFVDAFYLSGSNIYNYAIGLEYEIGLVTLGHYNKSGRGMQSVSLFYLTANGVMGYDGMPMNAGFTNGVFKLHLEGQVPFTKNRDIVGEINFHAFGIGSYRGIYKVGDTYIFGYDVGWNTVERNNSSRISKGE